jgi:hypothetical protein
VGGAPEPCSGHRCLAGATRGASLTEVGSSWQFSSRADLEAALRLEFAPGLATVWLADHPDARGLTYGYVLFAVSRPS